MTSRIIAKTLRLLLFPFVGAVAVLPISRASAQEPARQIVDDAAKALGGRERILALKTLLLEGGGHDFEIDQGLRWDELGMQSDVSQIRDYKRAYDLTNGRGRFAMTR